MKELRIFGPPGTGKSTRLATKEIPAAIKQFGPDKIVVTSFTRTAAMEIANKRSLETEKTINVPHQNIGTLHALCFRQLGSPKLAYSQIQLWNESARFDHRLGNIGTDFDNGGLIEDTSGSDGTILLTEIDRMRNQLVPEEYWPPEHQEFNKQWTRFKQETETMDFMDLLDAGIKDLIYPPNRAEVIFVDEAQDFTRLQLKLIRKWGQTTQWIVLVGDDDQCLFSFAGATPDAFLNPPIDNKYKRFLDQSWRVPEKVHAKAMEIVNQIKQREPKTYRPTIIDGEVCGTRDDVNYKHPEHLIDDINKKIRRGSNIMYLAPCSYMLAPMIKLLKEESIPFWNPYRTTRGDWNPMRGSTSKVTSAKDLLLAFLSNSKNDAPHWDVKNFVKWARFITTKDDMGLIRKQGKTGIKALEQAIEDNAPGLETTRNVAGQILTEQALTAALNRDVGWLKNQLMATRKNGVEYPVEIYLKNNKDTRVLSEQPKVIVGTIHSVKGGEASSIYVVPDISAKSKDRLRRLGDKEHDTVLRMFYVAVTRAKNDVTILSPATNNFERLI